MHARRSNAAQLDPVTTSPGLAHSHGSRLASAVPGRPIGVGVSLASERWEQLNDKRPKDRQAGAHDGHVRLDNGPHDVCDVVRVVGRLGKDVQRRDAQTRRHDHEDAHREHGHKRDLLGDGHLKPPYEWHGQQQYNDICSDGEARVGKPEVGHIDARPRDALVKRANDGAALEDGGGDRGGAVDGDADE